MGITINDTFKIHHQHPLTTEDYNALAQLYLPIIGIDSFGLYIYINTLEENCSYDYKKLIDVLNLHSLNFVEKAFSKLEAVSLIDTFYNEQKGYIYFIKTPLLNPTFFQDSILASFLRSQIGEVEFDNLKNKKVEFNTKGFKIINKSFDEVFEIVEDNIGNAFSKLYNIKKKPEVKVNNPNFDYIFFKMNFDTSFIDTKILDDEEFKQQILNISYNYKLNEEEMKEVILKTMTVDKDLKYTDISKNARILYQTKNKSTKKKFVTKEPDVFLDSQTDDETYHFLEMISNIEPSDLLEQLNGGIKPSVSELKIFEDLMNNTKFPVSVINVMILMVNNEKEGALPGYNYFEKIANTWARANIKTALDAINFINKSKIKTKETKYVRGKKEASLPEWYDKYQKDLESVPKQETLSKDEIKAILESAKDEFE